MSRPNVHNLPQFLRKDSKGYFIDYRVESDGLFRRKRVRLGNIPLVQAKRVLAEHMQDIVNGRYLKPDQPKVTFAEAAEEFLAHSHAMKKSHRRDDILVKHLGGFFGGTTLTSLNLAKVDEYTEYRRKGAEEAGKPLKGATLNREIACLKAIIRRAMLNRKLDFNPIQGVKFFREYSRNRTLTPEEYHRLLGSCAPHMRDMVQLAYVTGMRRNEILGLRWAQVDQRNGVIILAAEDTKTREQREIPLDEELIELFGRIPRVLNCPHVFTFRKHNISDPKGSFRMACKRAGIVDFHFHDLRHCAITNFRKAGVGDNTIMSISGHKTHDVFRRYDRIDREDRQDALNRVRQLNEQNRTRIGLLRNSRGVSEKTTDGISAVQ